MVKNGKGFTEISLSESELAGFYSSSDKIDYLVGILFTHNSFNGRSEALDLKENEYLYIKQNNEIVDKFCYQDGELRPLKWSKVNSEHLGKMTARNREQECAFDMLQDTSTHIKLLTGRFGSGKSVLMIAHALDAIEHHRFDKIIYIRNNIELKDTAPLGALPGTLDDKMINWAANVGDHVGGMEGLKMLMHAGKFEIAPLGYLRGRDLRNSIIFCDEAENLTTAQVQLLIGRIGEGSQLWLAGDRKQTDKAIFEKDSGIGKMIERLRGRRLFAYVNLEKCERSEASSYADFLD